MYSRLTVLMILAQSQAINFDQQQETFLNQKYDLNSLQYQKQSDEDFESDFDNPQYQNIYQNKSEKISQIQPIIDHSNSTILKDAYIHKNLKEEALYFLNNIYSQTKNLIPRNFIKNLKITPKVKSSPVKVEEGKDTMKLEKEKEIYQNNNRYRDEEQEEWWAKQKDNIPEESSDDEPADIEDIYEDRYKDDSEEENDKTPNANNQTNGTTTIDQEVTTNNSTTNDTISLPPDNADTNTTQFENSTKDNTTLPTNETVLSENTTLPTNETVLSENTTLPTNETFLSDNTTLPTNETVLSDNSTLQTNESASSEESNQTNVNISNSMNNTNNEDNSSQPIPFEPINSLDSSNSSSNSTSDNLVNILSNETSSANNSVVLDYNSTQGKYINATGFYQERYIDQGVQVVVIQNETKKDNGEEKVHDFYEDRYKETD